MTDISQPKIPVLTRNRSWVEWSRKFKASLRLNTPSLDRWLTEEPTEGNDDEATEDGVVLSKMILSVGGDLISIVDAAETACQAYIALQNAIVQAEAVRRSVLASDIEGLNQMSEELSLIHI